MLDILHIDILHIDILDIDILQHYNSRLSGGEKKIYFCFLSKNK